MVPLVTVTSVPPRSATTRGAVDRCAWPWVLMLPGSSTAPVRASVRRENNRRLTTTSWGSAGKGEVYYDVPERGSHAVESTPTRLFSGGCRFLWGIHRHTDLAVSFR